MLYQVYRGCAWDRFCSKYIEDDQLMIVQCRLCDPEFCGLAKGSLRKAFHVFCTTVMALFIQQLRSFQTE